VARIAGHCRLNDDEYWDGARVRRVAADRGGDGARVGRVGADRGDGARVGRVGADRGDGARVGRVGADRGGLAQRALIERDAVIASPPKGGSAAAHLDVLHGAGVAGDDLDIGGADAEVLGEQLDDALVGPALGRRGARAHLQ